jgi:hypothetical protein
VRCRTPQSDSNGHFVSTSQQSPEPRASRLRSSWRVDSARPFCYTVLRRNAITSTRLYQRLRYLRNLEALSVLLLPAFVGLPWFAELPLRSAALRFSALLLVVFIVALGALYWHLKLRQMRWRKPFPSWFRPVYHTLYWVSFGGLVLFPLWLAVRWMRSELTVSDFAWAGGLYLFAVAELVNYYHRQLAYFRPVDWRSLCQRGKLRRAALAQDLALPTDDGDH